MWPVKVYAAYTGDLTLTSTSLPRVTVKLSVAKAQQSSDPEVYRRKVLDGAVMQSLTINNVSTKVISGSKALYEGLKTTLGSPMTCGGVSAGYEYSHRIDISFGAVAEQ